MPLDFPPSPTDGQVYANWIYSTSKAAWQAKPLESDVAVPSPTPPSTPNNGDLWFNSNDGNLYVYYNDGDTSQWVQVKSDATLSSTLGNRVTTLEAYPTGLVDITPSSVTVGSGSATVDSSGLVTFTGASSVSLNSVFTSAYRNYKIILHQTSASTTGTIGFRFRAAGVDATSALYDQSQLLIRSNSTTTTNSATGATGTTFLPQNGGSNRHNFAIGEVIGPQLPSYTGIQMSALSNDASSAFLLTGGTYINLTTLYDGFTVYMGSGNFTGTLQVYGYR